MAFRSPSTLGDVSRFPYLTAELLRRGYSEAEVVKIIGGNTLRALRDAEHVAEDMNQEFPDETLVSPNRPCRTHDAAHSGNPL